MVSVSGSNATKSRAVELSTNVADTTTSRARMRNFTLPPRTGGEVFVLVAVATDGRSVGGLAVRPSRPPPQLTATTTARAAGKARLIRRDLVWESAKVFMTGSPSP